MMETLHVCDCSSFLSPAGSRRKDINLIVNGISVSSRLDAVFEVDTQSFPSSSSQQGCPSPSHLIRWHPGMVGEGGYPCAVLSWFLTQAGLGWPLGWRMLGATGPTWPRARHGIHCSSPSMPVATSDSSLPPKPSAGSVASQQIGIPSLCRAGSPGSLASHCISRLFSLPSFLCVFCTLMQIPVGCSYLRVFSWFEVSPSLFHELPPYPPGWFHHASTPQFQTKKGKQEHVGLTFLFSLPLLYPAGPEELGFASLRGKIKRSLLAGFAPMPSLSSPWDPKPCDSVLRWGARAVFIALWSEHCFCVDRPEFLHLHHRLLWK